ncbi:hypothetical protein KAU33_09500 [Candidatus Dependentiae bacterium]|nr:hypothetical protein [Candidatus Dependentiae bacterium]
MKVIWLSANKFGYQALITASKIPELILCGIITSKEDSPFVIYDKIPQENWNRFNVDVTKVSSILESLTEIEQMKPDLLVVIGWREIIPLDIIKIPKLGTIGFHPTLLPYGRGSAPIINTIFECVKKSGVTMFYLDEGLDSGDIIGQEKFSIDENDYALDIYEKVIEAGKKLIFDYFPLIDQGTAPRIPQDNKKAFYFKKPKLRNNRIDLKKDNPKLIIRKIRALSKPYKGAYIKVHGKKLRIWKAEIE